MLRLAALAAALVLGACAPRLSPVYRDYAVPEALAGATHADSLRTHAAAALHAAGWTVRPPAEALPGTLRTTPRTLSNLLLYRNQAALLVFPIGGRVLRVQVQPVRRYLANIRTSLPYLPPGYVRAIVPPLDSALRHRGFTPVPSGPRRDQEGME